MTSITLIPEGPSLEGSYFIEGIKFSNDVISFWEKENLFFFDIDGWENYGPFDSKEKALTGLAKVYFDRCEKYQIAYSKIDDLLREL